MFMRVAEISLLFILLCACTKNTEPDTSKVTDIDGNEYNTVTIGTQTWMAEDLRTTKYNDGTAIHRLTIEERNCISIHDNCPYYTGPYYMPSISALQGIAYDFGAVYSKKLAPKGWHVPSNEDMAELVKHLGGSDLAGGKLKETGIIHWLSPNTGATNETGFTAIPAYSKKTEVENDGSVVRYWSVDYISGTGGQVWSLFNNSSEFKPSSSLNTGYGYTVRCIKDK